MVSVAVFIVVVSIAVGAYVYNLRTQRAAVFLMAVNDNVSLMIEQMAREMRLGAEFVQTPGELSNIQFFDQSDRAIAYELQGTAVARSALLRGQCPPQPPCYEWLPMTSELVRITALEFERLGLGGVNPERITIALTAEADHPLLRGQSFPFQTTVTVRE